MSGSILKAIIRLFVVGRPAGWRDERESASNRQNVSEERTPCAGMVRYYLALFDEYIQTRFVQQQSDSLTLQRSVTR